MIGKILGYIGWGLPGAVAGHILIDKKKEVKKDDRNQEAKDKGTK